MDIVDIRKAKTHLSRLVDEAAQGKSFIITKAGKPMVKVTALDASSGKKVRRLGFLRGQFAIPDDFNTFGSRKIVKLFSLIMIVAIFSVCKTIAVAAAPNALPGISLEITAIQETVDAGSPVLIKVVLTNISNHDLAMTSDTRGFDFQIEVRDSKGALAPDTRLGYVWNGNAPYVDPAKVSPQDLDSSAVYGTLKAGATFTRQLNAAKLYQMNAPGKFTIQVRRRDPANPSMIVKSNIIAVTVRN
jgi:prevent-host-death family protein